MGGDEDGKNEDQLRCFGEAEMVWTHTDIIADIFGRGMVVMELPNNQK